MDLGGRIIYLILNTCILRCLGDIQTIEYMNLQLGKRSGNSLTRYTCSHKHVTDGLERVHGIKV